MSSNRFLFDGQKTPKSLTKYNLYRGVTDFGTLEQFNIYQSGHSFLKVLQYPEFLRKLAQKDEKYKNIIENALHVMEYEFKGLDGIEDMTTNTMEITDGVNGINVINSVKKQSASTVSMRYTEKSGALLTKFQDLYLTGIYDPRSTYKHYHGLIESGELEAGYENEIFTMLYWVTDSTGLATTNSGGRPTSHIEKAYLIIGGQLNKSDQSIFNTTKGEHDAKEITIELNCFLAESPQVTDLAHRMLSNMNIIRNVANATYSHTSNWQGKL